MLFTPYFKVLIFRPFISKTFDLLLKGNSTFSQSSKNRGMERHKIGNINGKLTCVLFQDIKQEASQAALDCIYFFI